VSEAEPHALARPDAEERIDTANRIDGTVQKRVENRVVRFGTGLDPEVLRKLEDHLAKDFTLPVAKDE
jgi:hypothetical protein